MNIELIIDLIASLLGTGGLITLFLITEKKAAAQLANSDRINEQWRLIVEQKDRDFSALNHKYEAATQKIERLYDDNSELRTALDTANTERAVSKVLRCDCLECSGRKPPFGSSVDVGHLKD